MKHVTKKLFSILLLSTVAMHAASSSSDVFGRSVFAGGFGTAGLGLQEQAHSLTECESAESITAHVSAGFTYARSHKKDDIAKFFSPNNKTSFVVGADAGADTDVSGINFFLAPDYKGTVTFNAKFETMTVADLRAHVALDEVMEGLWLNASLPVVHAKWDLGLKEVQNTAGTVIANDHLMKTDGTIAAPYAKLEDALKGDKDFATPIATVNTKLTYGKVDGSQKETSVGDARVALGYNFINKENARLGLGVVGIFSGADKTKAEYLNAPVIGLAGRYAIGGRVDGSVRLWENTNNQLHAHLRGDFGYVFKKTMTRSYDWKANGEWSRYIILRKQSDIDTVTTVTNGVNVTTLDAKVGDFFTYDANLMLAWCHNAWDMNVGYNIAGMSKEKQKDTDWVGAISGNYYFYSYTNTPLDSANGDGELRQTVSAITIDGTSTAGDALTAQTLVGRSLKITDLNKDSGLMGSAMTHRIFGGVSYRFEENEWLPTLGVTGSGSFSSNNKAMSEWSVGAFGAICF